MGKRRDNKSSECTFFYYLQKFRKMVYAIYHCGLRDHVGSDCAPVIRVIFIELFSELFNVCAVFVPSLSVMRF